MRSLARELAFKLIFERLFVKENYTFDEEFFVSLKKDEDKNFSKSIVLSFEKNKNLLEKYIKENLIGYEIERVYKVDLALMFEALTEIYILNTPPQIVVNEVVNLAKKYSTEKSGRFINGVLSSILKSNRLQEKKQGV